jgi:hypothetical protein
MTQLFLDTDVSKTNEKIARYNVLGDSTLNVCNFSRYGAICKIACYIVLKHHSISAISNIARYFFRWIGCGVSEHIM